MIKEITSEEIREEIRNIPDFPKNGIQFKDITTVLKQPDLLSYLVDSVVDLYKDKQISKVAGIESRGFILGGAIATRLGAGFVPLRKPGKLPAETYSVSYSLEYGTEGIEIHKDALSSDDIVLLHDDLLATGGTARAAIELLHNFHLRKIYVNFFCELDHLNGRQVLKNYDISSLIHL
ncbi:MAG: adenine phosphoribosyltransferase [Bacteroidales bacterium]|jgi:adenine phosphoribosyltransferase